MFTGVGPGEHGIYQFWQLQAPNYRPALVTVGDFGREPLWRTLERHGLAVGLYHVPMTHPPAPLERGFMVTWPLTPTLGYAHPKDLIHDLARQGLHYQSDLVTMYRDDVDYLTAACEQIERKTDTILYLLEARPVDVLIAVFTEVDRVSHYYWGQGDEPGPEVETAYRAIDRALERLLDAIDDDVPVVVASDHGFGLCRATFNVNALLEQAGLLACRASAADAAAPRCCKRFFTDVDAALAAGWFTAADSGRTVDWSATRAFMPAPGCFGVNLNRRGRQRDGIVGDDAEAVARDVIDAIAAVRLDDQPVFDVVPRESVYCGHRVADAPDLILLPRRWDVMAAPAVADGLWGPPAQAGIHRPDGILFARGLSLAAPARDYAVEDVAPTCLARLGLPVPDHLDGTVRDADAVAPARERARRFGASPAARNLADQVEIERRLAQLGYL